MGFKSVLSAIGGDVVKVFAFFGSPKGQAVVRTAENVTVAAAGIEGGPVTADAVKGFLGIANNWMIEILKAEALASAAGQQAGSGVTKATAVLASVAPQVISFARQQGLPEPTVGQLTEANAALVAFGNALSAGTVGVGSPVTATSSATADTAVIGLPQPPSVSGPGVGQA